MAKSSGLCGPSYLPQFVAHVRCQNPKPEVSARRRYVCIADERTSSVLLSMCAKMSDLGQTEILGTSKCFPLFHRRHRHLLKLSELLESYFRSWTGLVSSSPSSVSWPIL
jgi:hypothetical protein